MSSGFKLCELCSSHTIRQLSKSTVYIHCTCNDLADRNKYIAYCKPASGNTHFVKWL